MNKKKYVIGIYLFAIALFLIYCTLRVKEYSYVREIDVADYLVNENAFYAVEKTWYGDSYMGIEGYFYWYGDVDRPMHCTIGIWDEQENIMYEVPTQFMEREDEKEKYSPISHFGFTCRVNTQKVDLNNKRYRLCYIDKGNEKNGVIAHLDVYIGKEENQK